MNKKKVYRYIKQLPNRLGWQRVVRCYNHTRFLFRKPYINIQSVMAVEGRGLYVSGWLLGPPDSVKKITLSAAGAPHRDISADLIWQQDDTLSKGFGMYKDRLSPRFIGLIDLPDARFSAMPASRQRVVWSFELNNGRSRTKSLPISLTHHTPLAAIESILENLPLCVAQKRLWFDKVYGPTVSAIWASRAAPDTAAEKVNYNPDFANQAPDVSLVIPIYGRYDFIEYQLSEFVNDPDMLNHEIIYVIDDPRLAAEIRESAQVLERIYKIAFSIVYLPQNLGFSGASNEGARSSIAKNVLMLNSDVMPSSKGWLSQLLDRAGDDINNTITGARLLYEDNSIQHNGMKFFASPFANDLWTNVHPSKGMPTDIVESRVDRFECEVVTGACILMTKKNFTALGGFDENYILGDYEDSDLCMKAREKGLRIVMDDQVVLYHLERQSQSMVSANQWKEQITYYNCWLHNAKWDNEIRQLKDSSISYRNDTAKPSGAAVHG